MVWPRSPADPWYLNYGMVLTSIIVLVCGGIYMIAARPYERGQAAAGDAHLMNIDVMEQAAD